MDLGSNVGTSNNSGPVTASVIPIKWLILSHSRHLSQSTPEASLFAQAISMREFPIGSYLHDHFHPFLFDMSHGHHVIVR